MAVVVVRKDMQVGWQQVQQVNDMFRIQMCLCTHTYMQ